MVLIEPPVDYQLGSLEKLEFYPKVFRNIFHTAVVSFRVCHGDQNRDGLVQFFPQEKENTFFWPAHQQNAFKRYKEGEVVFDDILIDRSFRKIILNRKPRPGNGLVNI